MDLDGGERALPTAVTENSVEVQGVQIRHLVATPNLVFAFTLADSHYTGGVRIGLLSKLQ